MIINRVLKANIVNLYCVHMREIFWSEMKISFILFMLAHSKDMCAKYGRSRMNNVHTISPSDLVGLPKSVVRSTAFFLDSESIFCTTFVSAIGRSA